MAYIMHESGGDFQQGGCLYKPNQCRAFNEYPNTHGGLDRPQKQTLEKADQSTFGSGVVVIS